MKIFDYIANKGSLYSETGILGVVTGGLLHTKTNKGWMLPCTASKYITFTLPSLAQKSIITVTKINNNYVVTQNNTTATITSLVLNNANYLRYIIYDSVASATSDLKNIQAWVNILQPLTYQKRLLSLPKPTELKQSGLVAAYNMKPVGNVLHDISGNGNHCNQFGILHSTVKSVVFRTLGYFKNTSFVGLNTGLNANRYSISFRIKNNSTAQQQLIQFTGTQNYIADNKITLFGTSNPLTQNSSMGIGQWNTITFLIKAPGAEIYMNGVSDGSNLTYTENISALRIFIGTLYNEQATLKLNAEIQDIRIHNRLLTAQEIKAYHNSFNEVILHEKFEDMAVGSAKLPNGWIKNGGSFVCGESTTNDAVIKSIRKGTKYLRCVTAGIVAIPCKWVNGTIEFSWYKAALSNVTRISFIDTDLIPNNIKAYIINIETDNSIRLVKTTVSNLIITTPNYITINTYYRIRITRTTSGIFSIYILGGNFTSWTLVGDTNKDGVMNNQDAQWGSGSNPVSDTTYNSSSYFVIDLDANDRVSDILIQNQIKA